MGEPSRREHPDDGAFDARLQRHFRGLRRDRGPCPSSEILTQYAFGDLPPDQAKDVRDHVARCGLCDAVLNRMETSAREPSHTGLRWLAAAFRGPLPAYALAALLAIPAWRGLRPAGPAPPPAAASSVEMIDLDPVRGSQAQRTGGPRDFCLNFFLPVPPGAKLRATIKDAHGGAVADIAALDASDRPDRFHLFCRAAGFPAGRYEIEVVDRENPQRVWRLAFER